MINLVIFDLDGTLLNTITDLATGTNHALQQNGFPTHPIDAYRQFVGNGILKLFERALPEGQKNEENILRLRETFLPYYKEHDTQTTAPYPGIPTLLKHLQDWEITLAVASNKYHTATTRLIEHFFPNIAFADVLGQREGVPPKPDPTIVRDILRHTSMPPRKALYVGDSGIDIQTAHNSGIQICAVTWGFCPREQLQPFQPTYIADTAEEVFHVIFPQNDRFFGKSKYF